MLKILHGVVFSIIRQLLPSYDVEINFVYLGKALFDIHHI